MRAKSSLQEKGIPYTDVSLDKYPHARHELQMRTGKRTVPQVFFNAKHIGGNEELQELVRCSGNIYFSYLGNMITTNH